RSARGVGRGRGNVEGRFGVDARRVVTAREIDIAEGTRALRAVIVWRCIVEPEAGRRAHRLGRNAALERGRQIEIEPEPEAGIVRTRSEPRVARRWSGRRRKIQLAEIRPTA